MVWTGKPYMRKTVVKFLLLFLLFLLLFLPLFALLPALFLAYVISVPGFFLLYYYWKSAHTYYVTESSVLITRRWAFGAYQREITLDRIEDVHVQQGLLARIFNCGSVVFVTGSRLEVGY